MNKKLQNEKKKDYAKIALQLHKKNKGKLSISSKMPLKTVDDWSVAYTPGVGAVSSYLAKYPEKAREYTIKNNTVAVVSDGTAVLGLGNIGPYGALPVMEGKCAIFKKMADVNAFPICLDTQDPEEIIETVKRIAPVFGGINLEDIKAPQCFYIEKRLKEELDIPVMHDDQHGTAIIVLAGLINAAKVVKKNLKKMKIVLVGAGAAGTAITLILKQFGVENIIVVDSKGILNKKRDYLYPYKKDLIKITNPENIQGEMNNALINADAVVAVSGPGHIFKKDIEVMNEKAIVFALANPVPEIMPEEAFSAGAYIVATGRSDFPNQINNALVFPGIFRGALDHKVCKITDDIKIKAAKSLATLVKKPTASRIIPSLQTKGLVNAIAKVVR